MTVLSLHDRDHLNLVLATGDIGLWELDIVTGVALRNLRHDQIFGYDEMLPSWTFDKFIGHVVESERERITTLQKNVVASGEPWIFETRIRRVDGSLRWISARGQPIFNDAGDTVRIIGHVIDITHTKQNEERLQLLTSELDHRVNNTLALVKSMIRMSAKSATSVSCLRESLETRLEALARTHQLFVGTGSAAISLTQMIDRELAPFKDLDQRVTLLGDGDVSVVGRAAEGLSLVLHELVTNAVKYGAFSNADGRIEIRTETPAANTLRVEWREIDGPAVTPPTKTGFGSLLMETALGESDQIEVDYPETGVVCRIEMAAETMHDVPIQTQAQDTSRTEVAENVLVGKRVMILEDEVLIALDLAQTIEAWGVDVVGPCHSISSAMKLVDQNLDAAILDVNLGSTDTRSVAEHLQRIGVPFAFITGYGAQVSLPSDFSDAPVLSKPFNEAEALVVLQDIVTRGRRTDAKAGGQTSAPVGT